MAKTQVKPEYREIVKLFESLAGSRSLWSVYEDVMQMIAIAISNVADEGKRKEKREKAYYDIAKKYTQEEQTTIAKIFAEIVNQIEENPFRDFIGDLYMNLSFGSDALGQFFTPYNISFLMAECTLNIEEAKKKINERGFITIHEPSAGGGANIIAALEVLKNNDINYQTSCLCICQELSYVTALQCYIQLSLLGAAAVIKVGDTLADPITDYQTTIELSNDIWLTPMYQSSIWKERRIAKLLCEMVMK